jgi:hypothetical protein
MDKEKNWEKMFQDAFDEQHLEPQAWNTPSDNVWSNIEENLTPKKKRRVVLWWLPLLALYGIYTIFSYTNKNKSSNKTITAQQVVSEKKDTQNTVNQHNETIVDKKLSTTQPNITFQSVEQRMTEGKRENKNQRSKELIDNQVDSKFMAKNELSIMASTPPTSADVVAEKQIFLSEKNIDIDKDKTIEKGNRPLLNVPTIATLPMLLVEKNKNELVIRKEDINLSRVVKVSKKSLAMGVVASSFTVRNRVKGSGYVAGDYFDNAFQVGLSVTKNINKNIFIETGVGYSQWRYRLDYQLGLPYSSIETPTTQGKLQTAYNGEVPTAYGLLAMEMILARQSNTAVATNENIPIRAIGDESFHFVNVPILLGWQRNVTPKIEFLTKTGIDNHLLMESKINFQSVQSGHDVVQHNSTVVLKRPTPQRWSPGWSLGVGLDYQLSRKTNVRIEGFYQIMLRDMQKNINLDNKPHLFGLKSGFYYKF